LSGGFFVCYAREDTAFVERLYRALTGRGERVWLDAEALAPGANWREGVARGIGEADVVAFVVSPDSLASPACAHELEHALAHGKRLVAVLRRKPEDGTVPAHLGRSRWISMRESDDFDSALAELVDAIARDRVGAPAGLGAPTSDPV
jgi:TIR domain-containing protein